MRFRTVGQVSELTGVTVRTLHHYDEIGLVVPSGRSEGGYRLYGRREIARFCIAVITAAIEPFVMLISHHQLAFHQIFPMCEFFETQQWMHTDFAKLLPTS